jgi:uncharacterized membrane protein YkoI
MRRVSDRRLITIGLLLALSVTAAWAGDDDDHDRALGAVARGEALSLHDVLARVRSQVRGEVVGTAFNREHGRWIYEFRIVTPGGRLRRVFIDAATGKPTSDKDD